MMHSIADPLIIAEVGQAHDGNINIAHAFIDAVAKTGADAIKFQTHYADEETTPLEPWRTKFSWIDETRYEYWKRMEFLPNEWISLAEHAKSVGLLFLSSPFSLKAVDVLKLCNMKFWKIASGELLNYPLIDAICQIQGNLILSCGLSEEDEIEKTVSRILANNGRIYSVLDCVSKYPSKLEEINLGQMISRGNRLQLPYGLSDHSADILPSICAMIYGANIIEVHITIDRNWFGPDNSSSLNLSQLKDLCTIKAKLRNLINEVQIDQTAKKSMQMIFRKSIYASKDIKIGERIKPEDLSYKKPPAFIGAENYEDVIGRIAINNISSGSPVDWTDFTK